MRFEEVREIKKRCEEGFHPSVRTLTLCDAYEKLVEAVKLHRYWALRVNRIDDFNANINKLKEAEAALAELVKE